MSKDPLDTISPLMIVPSVITDTSSDVPSAPQPKPAGETKIEQPGIPENHVKNTQEERKMADNITPVVNETKPVSDEVSVITEGTIIKSPAGFGCGADGTG